MDVSNASSPSLNLREFLVDLLFSGTPVIRQEEVQRVAHLASGNTFTVCSGRYRGKDVAVKYFNFTPPQDLFSSISLEVAAEKLREDLANASHELRIMTNNVLRHCPSIATIEGIFFESDQDVWIRPALVMELACPATSTLSILLKTALSPILKLALISNILDGLYALHSVKICHGDIKPDNILIFPSSAHANVPYQARISDFGFAFVSGQAPRGTGTEGWCAPECYYTLSEPLLGRKAYGRDVYSAALVVQAILDAPPVDESASALEQDACNRSKTINSRIQAEILPQMLNSEPQGRPWIEDLRKELKEFCDCEDVKPPQWSWVASQASMTQIEIEPASVSAELKGRMSSWLVFHRDIDKFTSILKSALFQELHAKAADLEDPARADNLYALFACYQLGKLTRADSRTAWTFLFQAARAGSPFAGSQVLTYVLQARDFDCCTSEERRDWSLSCLAPREKSSYTLLMSVDADVCEKGLRPAVYDHCLALGRLRTERASTVSFADMFNDRFETQERLSVSFSVPEAVAAISSSDFERLQNLVDSSAESRGIRDTLLQLLLQFAVLDRQKQLLYFLVSHYSNELLLEVGSSLVDIVHFAIYHGQNDAVIWLLDLGASRKIFGNQLLFGRVVCNSSWSMVTTFIQACRTYYKDWGLQKLLNEAAPRADEHEMIPPLHLAILAGNDDSFQALLRYDTKVNLCWRGLTPLMLAFSSGLPHIAVQLIEKGANIDDCTNDEASATIAHVLADWNTSISVSQDRLLEEIYEWTRPDRSQAPFTASQARRHADRLLFAILQSRNAALCTKDKYNRTPYELSIRTGKLWLADLFLFPSRKADATELKTFRSVHDIHGRNFLNYAIEDDDHALAEQLLLQGYDGNSTDLLGRTVLHDAAQQNSLDDVLFCLRHGVDARRKDLHGRTALTWAITRGNLAMCKGIIDHTHIGILLTRTSREMTYLQCCVARSQWEILSFLLDTYERERAAAGLPELSQVILYADIGGRTVLHDICMRKTTPASPSTRDIVKRLVSSASDVSPRDCVMDTPLHDAANSLNSEENSLLVSTELLAAGADVNAENEMGNSPLHCAYARTAPKQNLVQLLLDNGASPALKNKAGFTAEQWAEAVDTGVAAAKEACEAYTALFRERSDEAGIQKRIQIEETKNEARLRENRLAFSI